MLKQSQTVTAIGSVAVGFHPPAGAADASADEERMGARQAPPAHRGRRGHLLQLVRAHGPGSSRRGQRAAFGSDAVSQELDSGALRGARARPAGRPRTRRFNASISRCVRRCCVPCRVKGKIAEARRGYAESRAAARPNRASRDRTTRHPWRNPRRLAARPAADLRDLPGGPLQHPGACRRKAGRAGAARRPGDVQSALHSRRRGAGENPSAAGGGRAPATDASARRFISPPKNSCTASCPR